MFDLYNVSLPVSTLFVRAFKTVCLTECKQPMKHSEPITKANCNIRNKDQFYTELQAYVHYPTNLNTSNMSFRFQFVFLLSTFLDTLILTRGVGFGRKPRFFAK